MRRFRHRLSIQIIWLLGAVAVWTAAIYFFARAAPNVSGALPLMVLVFFVALGGIGRGVVRRIARPVEELTEASRRFGAGDLAHRVPLPRWHAHHQRHMRGHKHPHARRMDELIALHVAWNEMAERIEKLVRGQRDLLANVSHELRSPLARLRLALELLPRDAEIDARLREAFTDIDELDRLIDDVLTASRLDGAGLPTHLEEVPLAPFLEGVVARAAHDPVTATHEVRIGAAAGTIIADPALLKRAVWNLVENAARYGAAPIVLRATPTEISVTDQGPGIPAADRERVLEPFVRGDQARTPGPRHGVGLGLTIARRVAEVHGGGLRLEDAAPGLRVVLTFP